MQHPRMSLIVFDRRRWSWGNQLWQSRDKKEKKKKKRERGSTSRTAWGSIYKRADKLSDFKKGSGFIKQPIVDARQLQRSAFPAIGSKRLSWCLRSAGQRQQTGSMSCESAELFDSTGLRDLKRRLGLLRASAFADDAVLLQPAFKGSRLVRLHSDRATDEQFRWELYKTDLRESSPENLGGVTALARRSSASKKNYSPLNVWHVARIAVYLRCDVSGDVQHTLTSIRGKPMWE